MLIVIEALNFWYSSKCSIILYEC